MAPEIHGHEVMDLMMASQRTFNRETLIALITEHFGREARFHTCSASGMTAEELIGFLARKEKFVGTEEAFTVNPQRVCAH